ncbi:hypothetical protein [Mahella australiensis]|uniref:Uncharacterized protein n=1 Tax=Mahella australiensis (strain DSM 15567 / CIP 107919 / 50-1 BON) TaxID=697281 RepID=F3ZXG7_MAHA5|nr:hypothetical protein [Mahella australiensis]AEE97648.1 protein of unknown function DUF335 SprT [Mahella australiensis 50-1 BON]
MLQQEEVRISTPAPEAKLLQAVANVYNVYCDVYPDGSPYGKYILWRISQLQELIWAQAGLKDWEENRKENAYV